MKKTIIIGAGPAGLATAGRMRKKGLPFQMLEKSDRIAERWHGHYDRLRLHTVKELSQLPHLPFPDEYPRYISRDQLIDYLEHYANKFNIRPFFNTPVSRITRKVKWQIETDDRKQFEADQVVIATGVNRIPYRPSWPGEDDFSGTISHSRTYKNPDAFKAQKVLVVGMGNTGAEIALDLAEAGIDVYLSVRSPVNIVPRDVFGRSSQVTAKKLQHLPFGLGDFLGKTVRSLFIGNLEKYGLKTSNLSPVEQLKTTGQSPVIDLGTVRMIKEGRIQVVSDIAKFSSNSIVFTNGESQEIDQVILATGYRPVLDEILDSVEGLIDEYGAPRYPVGKGPYQGLYFVGFNNYEVGGILGTIFRDSEKVVNHLQ